MLVLFWAALAPLVASLVDAFVVCDVALFESSMVSATAGALPEGDPRWLAVVEDEPPAAAVSVLGVSSAVDAGAADVPSVPVVSLLDYGLGQ